ncbi:MAG: tetratricopeptide repeat protein [Anaerolineales bacterium]|nr:tetratricopeptide repeat protein [Anaerolineales bacterium]
MTKNNPPKNPIPPHLAANFDALFRHGTQLLHRGKVADATPFLAQAHRLQPEHVDAGINLAGAYILSSQFKQAVAVLEPLAETAPDNAMLWTNLGAAYLGNPVLARDAEQRRAIAAFERALALNPAAPSVAYNIGLIYRDRRDREQAIHWFRRAIQANPNDRDARRLLQQLTDAGTDAP